jgi:hypothetical protein
MPKKFAWLVARIKPNPQCRDPKEGGTMYLLEFRRGGVWATKDTETNARLVPAPLVWEKDKQKLRETLEGLKCQ